MNPLLAVHDLHTDFRTSRGAVRAVDGVSFQLDEGECLGIVGESGSGKSVLVRTVMDLLPATASVGAGSRIEWRGRDILSLPPAEARKLWGPQLAMIFQDPATSLNPVRRIGDQIADPQRQHLGRGRKAAREAAADLLAQVGIADPVRRLRQYPHELSGGMRQRVMIAIALSCEPRLLIADEPTTALDVTVQRQILELLRTLQQERGMSMILISHDLGVVAGHTDRVAVMYAGRMVESAETKDLFRAVRHRYTDGLLRSTPRVEFAPHTRLEAIPGRPPDLVDPPPGCRFAPRCAHALDRCRERVPQLTDIGGGHLVACHNPAGKGDA
ncbi:ABC transporter ATP-binding protein [Amycolatopsis thermoflava]|uniref:ABC transporter ATP-binding protein n=1 Tax=Amycolatopsis thermoflava TaxID=84480 RepID=UPI00041A4721|nr:ABC transporter ATP-binding protein [Amycolatopsis thermoflava]